MRKFLIFFVIMVAIITFALTRSAKVHFEGHTVSEEEVAEYRAEILSGKYMSTKLTEEQVDKMVEDYIQRNTREPRDEVVKGMKFGETLKISIITSGIACGAFFFIIYF